MKQEPNVVEIPGPAIVVGGFETKKCHAIHMMYLAGGLNRSRFVFVGEFTLPAVFTESITSVCFLLALKITFRRCVYLVRGQDSMARYLNSFYDYGISDKEAARITAATPVWESMPLAAIISKNVFCVRGGLVRSLPSIADWQKVERFAPLNRDSVMHEIVHSKPACWEVSCGPNFGEDYVNQFLELNHLSFVVISHKTAFMRNKPKNRCYDGKVSNVYAKSSSTTPASFVKISADGDMHCIEYSWAPTEAEESAVKFRKWFYAFRFS
eukprot:TRINITY_DN6964_c0_g1_i1.p1 TRINITY_DN6964_c0_g1~~TRINITY_DN6964_c0_g1_i1.p1  ORF type:complete len:286 (-),score=25.21 TRINITY_DN6964_c0_g1_i1:608-1411(-)